MYNFAIHECILYINDQIISKRAYDEEINILLSTHTGTKIPSQNHVHTLLKYFTWNIRHQSLYSGVAAVIMPSSAIILSL